MKHRQLKKHCTKIQAAVDAWITHVVSCLAAGAWGFLIAGAVFFPVAIVHGIGIWFGFF